MSNSPRTVLLTGPPGAGKGTQSSLMAERHGWYVFSVGQLLRDTAPPHIKAKIDAGTLLPKDEVISLVVGEIKDKTQLVLVDGFPRRLDQIEAFDEIVCQQEVGDYSVVLISVDRDESWQRVMARGRNDDSRSAWEHRWNEYYEHTQPAIEWCKKQGKLLEVDGSGSVEEVYQRLKKALNL